MLFYERVKKKDIRIVINNERRAEKDADGVTLEEKIK